MPYLYVRDKIEFNANLQEIGSITNPVIVMADTIDGFGSSNVSDRIYGDLYLYSQSSASNLNLSGLSAGVQNGQEMLLINRITDLVLHIQAVIFIH